MLYRIEKLENKITESKGTEKVIKKMAIIENENEKASQELNDVNSSIKEFVLVIKRLVEHVGKN